MPSEIRPGTGHGTAAFPENAVLRKLRGLLPGRGEPPAPGQGTGQNPGVPACGAEEVFVSLSCYRSALRSAQKLCLILAGFAAAGLITGLCAVLARPEPVYFGMSQDMKLLPMTPLDKPVMNEAALKNWVAGAISASFNFDYLNWRSQLTDLRPYFTGEAFTRFAVSLDREGHLPLLRQRRALMHSVVQWCAAPWSGSSKCRFSSPTRRPAAASPTTP